MNRLMNLVEIPEMFIGAFLGKLLEKSFNSILRRFSERIHGAICGRISGGFPVETPQKAIVNISWKKNS